MNTFIVAVRTILGILYFVYGINGFLSFLPGVMLPGIKAENLYAAFESSIYILPMLHISAIIIGVSLLLNIFAALFLILFLPLSIQFSLFFYFLGTQTILSTEMFLPLTLNLAHFILLLAYYENYKGLFNPR